MEEFFQYVGPDGGAAASSSLLNKERLFVYSSPRENAIDRCSVLAVRCFVAFLSDRWARVFDGLQVRGAARRRVLCLLGDHVL